MSFLQRFRRNVWTVIFIGLVLFLIMPEIMLAVIRLYRTLFGLALVILLLVLIALPHGDGRRP